MHQKCDYLDTDDGENDTDQDITAEFMWRVMLVGQGSGSGAGYHLPRIERRQVNVGCYICPSLKRGELLLGVSCDVV